MIARFQLSGSLDTTFGFTRNGRSEDIVGTTSAVELHSDGKIVAAGDTGESATLTAVTTTLSNADFLIAR